MAELAVFGSGNPADIEEYFQAGADRFFIALSGDLKRDLEVALPIKMEGVRSEEAHNQTKTL